MPSADVVNIIFAELRGNRSEVRGSVTDRDARSGRRRCYWSRGSRGNVLAGFHSTTAKPCNAVHALIAPPTLTSGASAALTNAARRNPGTISDPNTLAPLPRSRTVRTEEPDRSAAHPGTANYTDNVTTTTFCRADHAERFCECLLQGDGTMGDSADASTRGAISDSTIPCPRITSWCPRPRIIPGGTCRGYDFRGILVPWSTMGR